MALLGWIVGWSLRNRPIVIIATVLFTLLGLRAAALLPIDAVPDITNVQVQVITAAPALSPVEVEQYVSVPVERALAGIPKSTEVRSISKYGLSVVTIVFHDDTDIYFARQLVNERMRQAEAAIPAQYGKPELGPITSGLGEIFQFTVSNERLSLLPQAQEDRFVRLSVGSVFRQFTFAGFAPVTRVVFERNKITVEFYDYKRTRTEFGISRAF